MHKEDKLSLNMNEDFELPNLEEGLEIDDIPSIEDLISLDKDEIEKIQETEIADVFNNTEDNSSIFEDNIDNSVEKSPVENPEFSSFDTDFSNMNLFDEDNALTQEPAPLNENLLEEMPQLETSDIQNETMETMPEIEAAQEIEPEINEAVSDDIFSDNDYDIQEEDKTGDIPLTEEITEISEEVQEEPEISEYSQAQEDNIPEDQEEPIAESFESFSDEPEITESEPEEFLSETTETIANDNLYTGETKHYSKTDDVFAKIDSLLNDDSAFEPDTTSAVSEESLNTFEEMPKPQYKSSFNPAKYSKKPIPAVSEEKEEKLGILYAARKVLDNIKTLGEELNTGSNQSIADMLSSEAGKKTLLTAAVCVAVLGAGITGVSLFNNKSVEEIDALNKNDVSTPLEVTENNSIQEHETQPVKAPVIDENTNVASDVPDLAQIQQPKLEVKQDVLKEEVKKQTKPVNPESYLSVKKIQWQVPDYLSYSPNIKSYLQTAGKSIKLGLSSDLLLASEYAYSNVVKVNLKLSSSGAVQSANVETSSGSKEIDNIVLQSVKSTLNVVKPPAGEVKTPDFNLTITIYL